MSLLHRPWVPVLAAALMARIPGLWSKPLWYDEAIAVLLSQKGPSAMIAATVTMEKGVAANVHPLGYFSLLWAWGKLFGSSPIAARSLSVLIGLAVVAAAYVLTSRLFSEPTAIILGWMMALSPFQVHYAQEVRMYGLLTLLLLLGALALLSAMRNGGWWRWMGFALFAAAAQYTHALAALALVPLALIPLLLRKWKSAIAVFCSSVVALLLYLPWLLVLPSQLDRVRQSYWIAKPGIGELLRTYVLFIGGSPIPPWGLPVVLFTLVLLLPVTAWGLKRARQAGASGASAALGTAYMSAAPVLLMFAISQWQPIYLDRAMLPASAAFLGLLAWLLAEGRLTSRIRWTAWITLGASFAVGLFGYYTYRGFPYAPYQELADSLGSSPTQGEVIVHSNKITALPSAYYAPGLDHNYVADIPGSGSDTLAPATQRTLGLIADEDVASAVSGAVGVWFVVFGREIDEYAMLGEPEHPSLRWLRANYRQEEIQLFGEIQLHHFSGRQSEAG